MHRMSFEIHPRDAKPSEKASQPWLTLLPFAALSGLLIWLTIF